jgi:hypothetical protein
MRSRERGHSPVLPTASKNPETFEDAEVGSRLYTCCSGSCSRTSVQKRIANKVTPRTIPRTCLALVDSSREEAALLYRLFGLVVRLATEERPLAEICGAQQRSLGHSPILPVRTCL